MALTDKQKQDIKDYLKENLTIQNNITSDPYENVNDQIEIDILLEGEVIASTTLYPMFGN